MEVKVRWKGFISFLHFTKKKEDDGLLIGKVTFLLLSETYSTLLKHPHTLYLSKFHQITITKYLTGI